MVPGSDRGLRLAGGCAALGSAALWTAGAFGTVRPEVLAGLLLFSMAWGLAVVLAALLALGRSGPRGRIASACALALVALAASGEFLRSLFAIEEGAVPVTRCVAAATETPAVLTVSRAEGIQTAPSPTGSTPSSPPRSSASSSAPRGRVPGSSLRKGGGLVDAPGRGLVGAKGNSPF